MDNLKNKVNNNKNSLYLQTFTNNLPHKKIVLNRIKTFKNLRYFLFKNKGQAAQ